MTGRELCMFSRRSSFDKLKHRNLSSCNYVREVRFAAFLFRRICLGAHVIPWEFCEENNSLVQVSWQDPRQCKNRIWWHLWKPAPRPFIVGLIILRKLTLVKQTEWKTSLIPLSWFEQSWLFPLDAGIQMSKIKSAPQKLEQTTCIDN